MRFYYYASDEVYEKRNFIIQKLYKQNDELWSDYHEIYYHLYGNSPKHVSPQQYNYDHLVENDQYDSDHFVKNDQCGQSINNQVIDFNRHKMSNDSSLDWNEAIRVYNRKVFVSNVESKENTDQFSKDETLIEETSILIQELILGGHEMSCEVNLEKNDFSMENNDQLAKGEEFSDEKFTNDLTQEFKLVGQQMSYDRSKSVV